VFGEKEHFWLTRSQIEYLRQGEKKRESKREQTVYADIKALSASISRKGGKKKKEL